MPIPENYATVMRNLGFTLSQGSFYFPRTARPHLHVTVESPQMNGGRVVSITGTTAAGGHTNYMVDGAVVGRLADLDTISAGWGDKAAAVLSALEG